MTLAPQRRVENQAFQAQPKPAPATPSGTYPTVSGPPGTVNSGPPTGHRWRTPASPLAYRAPSSPTIWAIASAHSCQSATARVGYPAALTG